MNTSVLDWLDQSVKNHADKIVFTDETESITFGCLDQYRRAIGTSLARVIRPNHPVCVMTGRNVLTPACFLGVVSAGCFYAPMDTAAPVPRLKQILELVRTELLLVDRETLELARKLDFQGQILVAEDLIQTEADPCLLAKAAAGHTQEDPLYVIFTSGSTGVPKGVITSHHALMCYIDAFCKVFQVTQEDIFGNQSPLDYIAAIRDIYIPLKTGASTVILPKKAFSMPQELFSILNKYKISALCWSAAGVELPAKLGAFSLDKPQYLKKLCFSGSVINCRYLKIWMEHLPQVLYVNQYGPTEATASCTYHVIDAPVEQATVLPIGRPYENYRITLLNEDLTQTPDGSIGEICVSGPILALGYYGDPQRTAESFIQNPLNPNYRELLYKTGDLGRWNDQGILEFCGRKDRQIKHMGHRIELGEIESVAQQVPGITECCAMYDKSRELLYLFYAGSASGKEIVVHFRKVLPGFMAPRKLIALDQLPKLPNGKLDMQTLKTYYQ